MQTTIKYSELGTLAPVPTVTVTRRDTLEEIYTDEIMSLINNRYQFSFDDPANDLDYIYTIKQDVTTLESSTIYGLSVEETYGTVEEGDKYFSDRIGIVTPWTADTRENNRKKLIDATRRIDLLRYKGAKLESDQVRAFPRTGMVQVPSEVKEAMFEIALLLPQTNEKEDTYRVTSRAYAGVRTTYDTDLMQPWIMADILSKRAWNLLTKFRLTGVGIERNG